MNSFYHDWGSYNHHPKQDEIVLATQKELSGDILKSHLPPYSTQICSHFFNHHFKNDA